MSLNARFSPRCAPTAPFAVTHDSAPPRSPPLMRRPHRATLLAKTPQTSLCRRGACSAFALLRRLRCEKTQPNLHARKIRFLLQQKKPDRVACGRRADQACAHSHLHKLFFGEALGSAEAGSGARVAGNSVCHYHVQYSPKRVTTLRNLPN